MRIWESACERASSTLQRLQKVSAGFYPATLVSGCVQASILSLHERIDFSAYFVSHWRYLRARLGSACQFNGRDDACAALRLRLHDRSGRWKRCIRQHTSAYVRIRQHTPPCGSSCTIEVCAGSAGAAATARLVVLECKKTPNEWYESTRTLELVGLEYWKTWN